MISVTHCSPVWKTCLGCTRPQKRHVMRERPVLAVYSPNVGVSWVVNEEIPDLPGMEQLDEGRPLDVLIAGGGPSGLALAACASGNGLSVGVIDPLLKSEWPNNYGVWVDEFEALGLEDCLSKVWPKVRVTFEEDENIRRLERPYGQVDKQKLKRHLLRTCVDNGVLFTGGKVLNVEHGRCSSTAVCTNDLRVDAVLIADATGFSRKLLEFESSNGTLDAANVAPGYQVTYGILAEVEHHPYDSTEEMVLMDWGSNHLEGDLFQSNEAEPSFLYVMPFSKTLIFLEETSLVDRPAVRSEDLKERLQHRMKALDIKVLRIIEEERAMIPMGGSLPLVPQSVLGIGGSSGHVHPSTGYMVARALEKAPVIADAIKDLVESKADRPMDKNLMEHCWSAAWPSDERRQWDFMNLGMQVLCELKPEGLRDFFRAFFILEELLWSGFLSWRLSGVQCIVMGISLLSAAPASFRLQLVWTTLPFLPEFMLAWTNSLFTLDEAPKSSVHVSQLENQASGS